MLGEQGALEDESADLAAVFGIVDITQKGSAFVGGVRGCCVRALVVGCAAAAAAVVVQWNRTGLSAWQAWPRVSTAADIALAEAVDLRHGVPSRRSIVGSSSWRTEAKPIVGAVRSYPIVQISMLLLPSYSSISTMSMHSYKICLDLMV